MSHTNTYKLQGSKYDIEFSFPFEERVAIRLSLIDKKGEEIERWEKKVSTTIYLASRPFFSKIHYYIDALMKGKIFWFTQQTKSIIKIKVKQWTINHT